MAQRTILFLHGFASSGQGTKASFLRERLADLTAVDFDAPDMNPTPQDFRDMTVTGMVDRLRQIILHHGTEELGLIGSSLGALVALNYAHRHAGVSRMLLLAPVTAYWSDDLEILGTWQGEGTVPVWHYAFEKEIPLGFQFHQDGMLYAEPVPPAAPTLIIHGLSDDVVPIQGSRAYAAAYPELVDLVEVEAEHTLNDQLDLIWDRVQSFLLA